MDRPLPPTMPKAVAPFVARAKELQSRDPVIAYWCKFKAAQLSLDNIPSDTDGRDYLEALMDDLESSKSALSTNELITDDAAGSAYIYNFAARVFDAADKVDRSGQATRMTAKEYLAASVFFDLLSIFGPLETEVTEKITYAKWKATSIAKAFREGREPTPGPAQGPIKNTESDSAVSSTFPDANNAVVDNDVLPAQLDNAAWNANGHGGDDVLPSVPTDTAATYTLPDPPATAYDLPSAPEDFDDYHNTSGSVPSAPPAHDSPIKFIPPPVVQQPSRRPANVSSAPPPPFAPAPAEEEEEWAPKPSAVDPTAVGNAQKHAKWAISALNYEDIETAKKELRLALQLIGG
ncbi:hypothetical protein EMMF5_001763 [Cystobasidiomycetes sp. EMM_F5]